MASPQLENGYLRIANEVWDALTMSDLTGAEFSVIGWIIRLTWGWGKKECSLPIAELCTLTNRPRTSITDALRTLKEKNVIKSAPGGGRGNPSVLSFNKDWESWIHTVRNPGQIKKLSEIKQCGSSDSLSPNLGQFTSQFRTVSGHKSLKTKSPASPKDIFKDNIKTIGAKAPSCEPKKPARQPDQAYEIFASEFTKHRSVPYRKKTADFVQLADLRKAVPCEDGIPPDWIKAIGNYFGSPQGKYTLADLCSRYDTFLQGRLDRFGKPESAPTKKQVGEYERLFGSRPPVDH